MERALFFLDAFIAFFATFSGEIAYFFLYSFTFSSPEKNGVSTGPGQTAVTAIFFFFNSSRKAREKLITYDFVAE